MNARVAIQIRLLGEGLVAVSALKGFIGAGLNVQDRALNLQRLLRRLPGIHVNRSATPETKE